MTDTAPLINKKVPNDKKTITGKCNYSNSIIIWSDAIAQRILSI